MQDQKTRSKGPKPTDQDQKEWAPFVYFVHAVAGSIIAMMHKMGMYRLRINYGVESVLTYLGNHILATLDRLISPDDERCSSRYVCHLLPFVRAFCLLYRHVKFSVCDMCVQVQISLPMQGSWRNCSPIDLHEHALLQGC